MNKTHIVTHRDLEERLKELVAIGNNRIKRETDRNVERIRLAEARVLLAQIDARLKLSEREAAVCG